MPTYKYKCECGREYTKIRPIIHDVSFWKCKCGLKAKQLVGGGTFLLQGSNWPGKEVAMERSAEEIRAKGPGVVSDPEKYQTMLKNM